MNRPKSLSIILTYYKGEKYIFHCVDSIISSYEQSQKLLSFEIIIVIDSLDDSNIITQKLTTKYQSAPIRIIQNSENVGVSRSRNIGLSLVASNYFVAMDQDDYVSIEYFSVLESQLDESKAVHVINGEVEYVNENKRVPIYYFAPKFTFKSLILQFTTIYTPGLVIFNSNFIRPEEVFIQTSEKFKGCDDWAAYLNILFENNISFKYIPAKIFVYCLHSNNYSHNKEEMERASISVIEHFLNRAKNKSTPQLRYLQQAAIRNSFLFDLRITRKGVFKLVRKYPKQFFDHYLLSFLKKDRLNRLIYRLSYITA